jgi:hypothetical protein
VPVVYLYYLLTAGGTIMVRALLIALAGILYFIISLFIFIPFRMKPVKNYNLFVFPLLTALFLYLFYHACTIERVSTAYLYAYFAGMLMWQVIGEIPYLRVNSGVILQLSDLNIKALGGYFYVLAGWLLLSLLWITGSIKEPAAFAFMIFMGIWTFEIYMDNYTAKVPMHLMPRIATMVMIAALIASAVILYLAQTATTLEQNTVMGGLLYLSFSIIFMSLTVWRKPLAFYLKHERAVIEHEVRTKQEELAHIDTLKQQLGMTEEANISQQIGLGR